MDSSWKNTLRIFNKLVHGWIIMMKVGALSLHVYLDVVVAGIESKYYLETHQVEIRTWDLPRERLVLYH